MEDLGINAHMESTLRCERTLHGLFGQRTVDHGVEVICKALGKGGTLCFRICPARCDGLNEGTTHDQWEAK